MPTALTRSARAVLTGATALLAISSSVHAQISIAEYAKRRAALAAGIDSGVVVAFGAVEPVSYWPTFHQLPGFYYFTGFGETDAVFLMVKRGGAVASTMFVPTRSPLAERWLGARARPADLEARIGIPGRDIAQLQGKVDSLAADGLPFYVIPDVQTADYAEEDSLTRGGRFLSRLRLANPWLVTHSLDSTVRYLRARKSPAEITLLRKAVEISVRAHTEAMKATAPGCGEYEIQALLEGTFRRFGGDRPGYGSIVGSGPNATILHYMEDSRVMRDGELLLIDAATSYDSLLRRRDPHLPRERPIHSPAARHLPDRPRRAGRLRAADQARCRASRSPATREGRSSRRAWRGSD